MSERLDPRVSIISVLADLKLNYSDIKPRKMIPSGRPDLRYKVKKGWVAGVVGALEEAVDFGVVLDNQLIDDIYAFNAKHTSHEFVIRPKTLKKDVAYANELIDKTLTYFFWYRFLGMLQNPQRHQ